MLKSVIEVKNALAEHSAELEAAKARRITASYSGKNGDWRVTEVFFEPEYSLLDGAEFDEQERRVVNALDWKTMLTINEIFRDLVEIVHTPSLFENSLGGGGSIEYVVSTRELKQTEARNKIVGVPLFTDKPL